jgi:RNA polymerase sigma factor (sigma-70 family)
VRKPSAGESPDDLTATLERIEPQIRKVLVRFHVPQQDAEDLLQEVVLAYLNKRHDVVSPDAWLIASLRLQCMLFWRRRRRSLIQAIDSSLLEGLAGAASPAQDRDDLMRDVSGAVSRLPGRCRSILRLRYGLDCAGPEIAERLGYRADTVRQVTLRCLSALSRQLLSTGYQEAVAR